MEEESLTKLDPNTGFPEVPEGYFWEINHSALPGYYRLELRRKLFWIFSEQVEFTVVEPPLSSALLNEEAKYVLHKWEKAKHLATIEDASNAYVGKYPPKNLKDTPID
jgi:hypothetical protein